MNRTLVIRLVTEVDWGNPDPRLERLLEQVAKGVKKDLSALGVKIVGHEVEVLRPSKEEAIRLIPRRIHYGLSGWSACDREVHAAKRLVLSWRQVTCKRCLKKMPTSDLQLEMI